ncbi:MAG: hypothetical protein EXX96DRAFT_603940 [Benjaminiella poitrasii]|nr:MAG: hypothetical protein EXX96DRAFT_603940 [Benjaminiella poitrasii]
MSKVSFRKLREKPILLITSILAMSGWCISFGGALALKVLNGAWWVVFYQLLIIIGHVVVFMSGTARKYKMAMLAFLATSIPLLTVQVDTVMQFTKTSLPKVPANAYVCGYIMLLIVQYTWMLIFGSDPTTFFGQLGYHSSEQNLTPSVSSHEFYSEKKLSESRQHLATSKSTSFEENIQIYPSQPNAATSSISNLADQKVSSSVIEFKEKVRAIHKYKANPEDPKELSFEKGEILQIVDRRGNWWHARKSNGVIGIVPSNYFS